METIAISMYSNLSYDLIKLISSYKNQQEW